MQDRHHAAYRSGSGVERGIVSANPSGGGEAATCQKQHSGKYEVQSEQEILHGYYGDPRQKRQKSLDRYGTLLVTMTLTTFWAGFVLALAIAGLVGVAMLLWTRSQKAA